MAGTEIVLSEVYYAPKLAKDLITLGCLKQKGCHINDKEDGMEIKLGNKSLFRVELCGSIFVAKVHSSTTNVFRKEFIDVVMNVQTEGAENDVQEGGLYHFHARQGHPAYDTIERMAKDPRSGIVLTDPEDLIA